MEYIQLIGGLLLLVVAGNYLVESAADIARKFHLSSLIIGMTIVAFGTSAPELLVSANAGLNGHPEIAIGNVIGSNIANIGFIMGLTVLIFPIFVSPHSIKIDWIFMMLVSVLLLLAALDGTFSRAEGIIAFLMLVSFVIWSIKNNKSQKKKEIEPAKRNIWLNIFIFVSASVGMGIGADQLVKGSSEIATDFGISERVISVLVVALGTSLPELTASVVAAFKKEADITIGNIIGSNIFNILSVLGVTVIIAPIKFSFMEFRCDFFWLLLFSFLLFVGMINVTENRKRYFLSGKISDLWSSRNGLVGRIWGGSILLLYLFYVLSLFY